MGRRSINTTKSGKFMNPTDQARKEARKKELKKNKKQRLLVRTAVLKNKDPGAIIEELDKLDEVEYNPLKPPELAEKVLRDKRKKLKETLDRVMRLYQKEEPTYWNELRQIEIDYERRRFHRIQYFESVKQAEVVNVEDIPLPPSADLEAEQGMELDLQSITAPPTITPHSILKKPSSDHALEPPPPEFYEGQDIPGPPPLPPPDFDSSDSEEDEGEDDEETTTTRQEVPGSKKSVRFESLDEMDKFMKEVEEEFKSMKEDDIKPPGTESSLLHPQPAPPGIASSSSDPPPPPQFDQQQQNLQSQMIRPFFPPLPPMMQQRFRYPPPPHMSMPPPPPRPRFNNRFRQPQRPIQAGPVKLTDGKIVSEAMIQAKPQIRSLSADVTRFVPVAVKTRKDAPVKEWKPQQPQAPAPRQLQSNKDDAYADFMKEMEGFL